MSSSKDRAPSFRPGKSERQRKTAHKLPSPVPTVFQTEKLGGARIASNPSGADNSRTRNAESPSFPHPVDQ